MRASEPILLIFRLSCTGLDSLHSRMCVRVIRTIGWCATRSHARAVQPGLHIAACPHPATGTISIALRGAIPAAEIARPVQRQTVADQPFPEIGSPDQTCRDRTAILVLEKRGATHRTSGDETIELICSVRATAIQVAVSTPAQLAAFRRIDSPKPDARPQYFQGITINDTGLTDKIGSQGRLREQQKHQ